MNIVIIGGGSIGSLFYASLCNISEINLSLLHKTQQQNLSFTNINGLSKSLKINNHGQAKLATADIVLICVKSYQVNKVLTQIQADINPNAIVILSHNGMGTADNITLQQPILTLLTTHGAKKVRGNHVIHTGVGVHNLGLTSGNVTSQHKQTIERFIHFINRSLPKIFWQEDIIKQQWLKLAINSVINPITAINNINNGEILQPAFENLIEKILTEVATVAEKQQVFLDVNELKQMVSSVAKATALNCSSMRSDILKNKTTEIDFINGYIVKLANKYHLDANENKKLYEQIKMLEQH